MKRVAGKPEWHLNDRQQHEAYHGRERLLPEVPLVGRMRLLDALPHALVAHTHPDVFEVHCVVRGVLGFWVGQRTYSVGPGMAFLTQPGELHGGVNDVLSPAQWYWIHLHFLRRGPLPGLSTANTRRIRDALQALQQPLFPCSPALRGCFERLLAEHRQRNELALLMARLTFHELLVCLVRDVAPTAAASAQGVQSPTMQAIVAWIDEHLTESLSIADIAKAAGLSPSGLRQHFRAELGCCPGDYVTRRRMGIAQELLRDPRRSITEIAMGLGYSTSAYFTAVFKRLTGSSPQEYRKRLAAVPDASSRTLW